MKTGKALPTPEYIGNTLLANNVVVADLVTISPYGLYIADRRIP